MAGIEFSRSNLFLHSFLYILNLGIDEEEWN
jgi:hypothetical protein